MMSTAFSVDAVGPRSTPARFVAFLSAVLAVVAVLAGCSEPPKRCCGGVAQGLAVVQGVHANAPATSDLTDSLTAAVDQQADVSIVEDDGAPYLVATAKLTSQAKNSTAREQEKSRLLAQLGQAVTAATPRTPQDDLLDAVALAARYLGSSGDRKMVVADSGLQTTGVLRFQQPGMLDAAPGDISALLARLHALPNLRGISVVLVGIGDVASPQKSLSQPERSNLVAIWESVLRRAGARVSVSSTPRQGAAPAGAPTVSVVPVSPVLLTLPTVPPVGKTGPSAPTAPTPLPAAQFFAPDSAALLDASAATAALKPFADAAITRHLHIDLLGTSARWGSKQGQITLSGRRAAAIAAILVHLGVPSTQVTSRGVGSYWPGYRSDLDDAGNLLPGPAALNRTVQMSFTPALAAGR